MNKGAERLSEKKWGIFTHYLDGICIPNHICNNGVGEISWNDAVNMYDVEKMAYKLHQMNVGYYFITMLQGTEHMMAPNATFDAIAGTKPGEACSIRDLPLELYEALKKYDIDLCLYFTGDGPYKHPVYGPKFGLVEPRKTIPDSFVEKWTKVIEEYAVRYGDKITAWWFDGTFCHFGYTFEQLDNYYYAVKKGNPDAAVAFNYKGVEEMIRKGYPNEEFTAGESRELKPKCHQTKYVDGALNHILAPIGYDPTFKTAGWLLPGLKHTKEYVRDYIRNMSKIGGAVTLDVHIKIDGSLDPEQEEFLRWVGNNL
jgi:hypothetical protein